MVGSLLSPLSDELHEAKDEDLLNAVGIWTVSDPPSFAPGTFAEDVANRTRHSKLFLDTVDPRSGFTLSSLAPLHFGSPGSFLDIENDIVPSTANVPTLGLVDLEMVNDSYEWFALDTFNTIPLILFRNRTVPDTFVTFNPQALQYTNDLDQLSVIAQPNQGVVAQVTGNELLWVDAYEAGRNLSFETGPGRAQKRLVLDAAPPAPPQFVIDGGNPVMELLFIFSVPSGPDAPDIRVDGVLWDQSSTRDTGDEVVFEKAGVPLFVFTQPFVRDALGNATGLNLTLSKQGPNLRVGIRTPLSFLENATYPITVDPSVDVQVGAGADDTDTENQMFSSTRGDPDVPGKKDSTVGNASFRFTGVAIAQGATITSATFEPFTRAQTSDGVGTKSNIYLEDDDNATAPTSLADFDGRNRTTNFTAWDDEDFPQGFTASPDISSAVEEVVGRVGWSSGASLQILWDDDGSSSGFHYGILTYDESPSNGAFLNITFSLVDPPTVETLPADPILGVSARLNGNLTNISTAPSVEAGFEWGDTVALGNATPTQTLTANGTFSFDLTGLTTSTTFFFRAVADGANGTTLNFTTLAAFVPPGVLTVDVDAVSSSTAILEGTVTTLGELNITEANVSFEFGFSPTLLDFNTTPELVSIPGSFSATIQGLDPGTTVFYRAVLEFNPFVFGQVESFTTPFEGFFEQPETVAAVVLSVFAILICLLALRRRDRGIAAICGVVIILAAFVWLGVLAGTQFAPLIGTAIFAVGLIIFIGAVFGRRL